MLIGGFQNSIAANPSSQRQVDMTQSKGDVLLVGSVPLESASEVFTTCTAALGDHLQALPDGEVGARKSWIQCQAIFVFDGHPAIETVARPKSPDGLSREYDDRWVFRLKPGTDTLDLTIFGTRSGQPNRIAFSGTYVTTAEFPKGCASRSVCQRQ